MRVVIGTLAALAGGLLGSAARGGVDIAHARLAGEPEPAVVNVTVSPVAAVAGSLVGLVLGVRAAFWAGAVLGAAGSGRIDRLVLGRFGIDVDELVGRATVSQADTAADC